MINKATPGELLKYARNDPLIHRCLQHWREGDIPTWEQTLVRMVILLSEAKTDLLDEVSTLTLERCPECKRRANESA